MKATLAYANTKNALNERKINETKFSLNIQHYLKGLTDKKVEWRKNLKENLLIKWGRCLKLSKAAPIANIV